MSPRPAPTRQDATAQRFLEAAADLIDAYLRPEPRGPKQSTRLRSVHFPAALAWLRPNDVIRIVAEHGEGGASRNAFYKRWRDKDKFLVDVIIYAIKRDQGGTPETFTADQAIRISSEAADAASLASAIIGITDGLLRGMVNHPRSYLVMHIGPLLRQYPRLYEAVLPALRAELQLWIDGYEFLISNLGLTLRPEWTPQRVALVLQALLDGFVLRWRVQAEDYRSSVWEGASAMADAIIAFMIGAIDWEREGEAGRVALDKLIDR